MGSLFVIKLSLW